MFAWDIFFKTLNATKASPRNRTKEVYLFKRVITEHRLTKLIFCYERAAKANTGSVPLLERNW